MEVGRAVRVGVMSALLLALMPAFALAQGQTGTIAGVAKDAHDGPLLNGRPFRELDFVFDPLQLRLQLR